MLLLVQLALMLMLPVHATAFAVVAYLPEWRFEGANWDVLTQHSTHILLFSLEMTGDGSLAALDRLPRAQLMRAARQAADANGAKLLICFGGNGRSGGFSAMVRSDAARTKFVASVARLCSLEFGFDGVDYNWEYPGYDFRVGYLPPAEIDADYRGLAALARETRQALGSDKTITLAYYPDTAQERYLVEHNLQASVNFFHSMAYDKPGQHSTVALAESVLTQARAARLPLPQVTLGLPFYGRDERSGDWKSYEDILRDHGWPMPLDADSLSTSAPRMFFNSVTTIQTKVKLAHRGGLGGVMIWEAGQDCRVAPVTHDSTTHPATCLGGNASSLLVGGISGALRELRQSHDEL